MRLKERYLQQLEALGFAQDSVQLEAIQKLEVIIDQVTASQKHKKFFLSKHLYSPIKGLYMWGGVGRGKTFLMDLFYDSLPPQKKMRKHFSHFMKLVHALLHRHQGQKNPLQKVALLIAKNSHVICFDEFFVEDIADAMILGNLFEKLFELGVVLVATSNIEPQKLYAGGLQRELFIPAIKAITQNTEVFNLDAGVDYRMRSLRQTDNYFFPANIAFKYLVQKFETLAEENPIEKDTFITIERRRIHTLEKSKTVVWFDFSEICGNGRGTNDYIALCQKYSHLIVSRVPILDHRMEDEARRFIALVDETYDRKVNLIIGADAPITELYQGERLRFAFERTESRLIEMQSHEYMSCVTKTP